MENGNQYNACLQIWYETEDIISWDYIPTTKVVYELNSPSLVYPGVDGSRRFLLRSKPLDEKIEIDE